MSGRLAAARRPRILFRPGAPPKGLRSAYRPLSDGAETPDPRPDRPPEPAPGRPFLLPATMKALIEFTERFGNMLSRALLTGLYFLVLGPFALLYKLVADPLHLRRQSRGNWTRWTQSNDTLRAARRQD